MGERNDTERTSAISDTSPPGIGPRQLAERLIRSSLLSKEQVQTLWKALPAERHTVEGFADSLLTAGRVTQYQLSAAFEHESPLLRIGAYTIVDKLGEGGMGQVFRAVHQTMKREVALKLVSSKVLKDEITVRRFSREVEAVARLSHPNIITAHDAGEVRGVHYLVMEYVQGADLSWLVRHHGPLPLRAAIEYTVQAARGLAYAHRASQFHPIRDIRMTTAKGADDCVGLDC